MAERYCVVDVGDRIATAFWRGEERTFTDLNDAAVWLAELPTDVVVLLEGRKDASAALLARNLWQRWRYARRVAFLNVEGVSSTPLAKKP